MRTCSRAILTSLGQRRYSSAASTGSETAGLTGANAAPSYATNWSVYLRIIFVLIIYIIEMFCLLLC